VHTIEAHNDYMQLLAEGGVALAAVVLAALVVLGALIRRRFRAKEDDPTTYWIRVGATTGLVAIAFQELVEFSLQMPGNAALFAVVAAIAIWPAGSSTDSEVPD
jgi:O-antigen ligase